MKTFKQILLRRLQESLDLRMWTFPGRNCRGNFVYFLVNKGEIVYVGSTVATVGSRVGAHCEDKDFDRVFYFDCGADDPREDELHFIAGLRPVLNGTEVTGARIVGCGCGGRPRGVRLTFVGVDGAANTLRFSALCFRCQGKIVDGLRDLIACRAGAPGSQQRASRLLNSARTSCWPLWLRLFCAGLTDECVPRGAFSAIPQPIYDATIDVVEDQSCVDPRVLATWKRRNFAWH